MLCSSNLFNKGAQLVQGVGGGIPDDEEVQESVARNTTRFAFDEIHALALVVARHLEEGKRNETSMWSVAVPWHQSNATDNERVSSRFIVNHALESRTGVAVWPYFGRQ